MPTTLSVLLSKANLAQRVAEGYVTERRHDEFPELAIFNYTPKCAFEGAWDRETLQSRGLIANMKTDQVLCRPPKKFFNRGQAGAPELSIKAAVTVTDKLDGSLALPYTTPDGETWVATRGSFHSEQAEHATDIWRRKHKGFDLPWGASLYFEFIAPWNRIVVDYGDLEDLVLLGAIMHQTGLVIPAAEARSKYGWTGLTAEQFTYSTLGEAVEADPRPNAEGYVISWGHDQMVKIKQEDYLDLHRAKFNTTPRSLHAALASGADREELVASLPDEFQDAAKQIVGDIYRAYFKMYADISKDYEQVRHIEDRKEFAEAAKKVAHTPCMFSIRDGKDLDEFIWKAVRPEATGSPLGGQAQRDDAD